MQRAEALVAALSSAQRQSHRAFSGATALPWASSYVEISTSATGAWTRSSGSKSLASVVVHTRRVASAASAPACAPADARCPSASRTGSGRSPARQPARPRARRPTGRARRRRTRREVSSRPRSEAPRRERARTHRSRRATHPRSWSVSLPSVPVTRLARIPTCLAPRPRTDEVAHSSARVEMPVPRLSRPRFCAPRRDTTRKVVASGFSWRRWYVVGSFSRSARVDPRQL